MFTLNDILIGCEGNFRLHGNTHPNPDQVFPSAQHDSRQVGPGDLFIAITGEKVDGHTFIPTVAQARAGAALCTNPADNVPPDFLQIVVPDVVKALHAIARTRANRQENTIFIGITGSNGKTSTKEAVAAVLEQHAPTLKTYASYNNEIGFPLTLLRLEPQHRYAVLEMGAQWVGELAWLCETIKSPDWSIITNIGVSHLEHFGSVEGIFKAKSELVQALRPDGLAILNYDDPKVRLMKEKTQAPTLYYGQGEGADVRAIDLTGDALRGFHFTLTYRNQQQPLQLHLPGKHNINIALSAAAVGLAAGMELSTIVRVLEGLKPPVGRGEIKVGPNRSTLIDDSYNASSESIIAITGAMQQAAIEPGGKRWAVLGDIFELGHFAQQEHLRTGEALQGRIDYLIAIGDEARYYAEGAIHAGLPEENVSFFAADVNDAEALRQAKQQAADLLKRLAGPQDLVLLKGSRGMRLESMLNLF